MIALDELSEMLSGPSRVIVISQKDIDLQSLAGENHLVVMKMVEGSHAAGGRGAGFGERRITSVAHYHYHDGTMEKLFETGDESAVSQFEIPYYVSRIPIVLGDGTQSMGYGVVEEELAAQMIAKMGQF